MKILSVAVHPCPKSLDTLSWAINNLHGRLKKITVTPTNPFFDQESNSLGYEKILVRAFVSPDSDYRKIAIEVIDSGYTGKTSQLPDSIPHEMDEDCCVEGCVSYTRGMHFGDIITKYISE